MESVSPKVFKKTTGTQCHALADLVVFGHRLDSTASKVFSNPADSVFLKFCNRPTLL